MPPVQLGEKPIYSGAWDCAVKTVKKEGFFGLYKGIICIIILIWIIANYSNTVLNYIICYLVLFCLYILKLLINTYIVKKTHVSQSL